YIRLNIFFPENFVLSV
ncbi:dynein heavy chain, putative, partial [Schistosoma mansoni]